MSVLFSTIWHLFPNFILLCPNNILYIYIYNFFIHHALQCKYCPVYFKVNSKFEIFYSDGVLKVQSFALVHPVICWSVENWDLWKKHYLFVNTTALVMCGLNKSLILFTFEDYSSQEIRLPHTTIDGSVGCPYAQ